LRSKRKEKKRKEVRGVTLKEKIMPQSHSSERFPLQIFVLLLIACFDLVNNEIENFM
jgi:hypothetical protein